ncbi:MAG TPA: glucosamine-6-phosphate isomerase [Sphaerochaeta sp.]|nr:glucosamine-6-phosphate isomerase [Sphaerochaeta sp.]
MKETRYTIDSDALIAEAKIPLIVHSDVEKAFAEMAQEMVDIIQANNAKGEQTLLIVPVGPVGQYPYFIDLVNTGRISLKDVWFISMDEYLNDDGTYIADTHRLSFRRQMQELVYDKIDEALIMDPRQRITPDPADLGAVERAIAQVGKVDGCFGGVGINGHLAFNEPEDVSVEEFATRATRVQTISCETRTVNSIGALSGAICQMPSLCVTVGMHEILMAKKIRLVCFRDWHSAVVRRAALDEVTAAFPVSLLQEHPDASIAIPEAIAAPLW